MSPAGRRRGLGLALALSLAAAAWVSRDEPATPEVVAASARERQDERASPAEPLRLDGLRRAPAVRSETDLFAARSWVAAPPPPAPPRPEKPLPPPLPFKYHGMIEEAGPDGRVVYWLVRGGEIFAVSPGDTFDAGTYRLEGVERAGLVIVHLPLAVRQTLPIGVIE